MIAKVYPGKPKGEIAAIPSKSHAHRLLIMAALANAPTEVACPAVSEDILATARCLSALTANIAHAEDGFRVEPKQVAPSPTLDCGESGSTYRFMLPVACALGADARFLLAGRLPERPMDALFAALEEHGVVVSGAGTSAVSTKGKLTGGVFTLPGDVSSQFISGLLMAAPRTGERCEIRLTSPLASRGYVDITLSAMQMFGVNVTWNKNALIVPENQTYRSPGKARAEGDWSNAAFFLCAAATSGGDVKISGLSTASPQGDREIAEIISRFGKPLGGTTVDLSDIPDLAPAIALLGAAAKGTTRLVNAERLRLKESDRIESIVGTLRALGADIRAEGNIIVINGVGPLAGGVVDSYGDHRIAMMAACAACISENPVEIARAEAVNKSYPTFFDDLAKLCITVQTEV